MFCTKYTPVYNILHCYYILNYVTISCIFIIYTPVYNILHSAKLYTKLRNYIMYIYYIYSSLIYCRVLLYTKSTFVHCTVYIFIFKDNVQKFMFFLVSIELHNYITMSKNWANKNKTTQNFTSKLYIFIDVLAPIFR